MAPVPQSAGFDYTNLSLRWTKATLQQALGSGTIVDQLWKRASELVSTNSLVAAAHPSKGQPNHTQALVAARDSAADTLVQQFGESIQIAGYPQWAKGMSLGLIKYISSSGGASKKTKGSASVKSASVPPSDFPARLEVGASSSSSTAPKPPAQAPQNTIPLTFAIYVHPVREGPNSNIEKIIVAELMPKDTFADPLIEAVKWDSFISFIQDVTSYTPEIHEIYHDDGIARLVVNDQRKFTMALLTEVQVFSRPLCHLWLAEKDNLFNFEPPVLHRKPKIAQPQTSIGKPSYSLNPPPVSSFNVDDLLRQSGRSQVGGSSHGSLSIRNKAGAHSKTSSATKRFADNVFEPAASDPKASQSGPPESPTKRQKVRYRQGSGAPSSTSSFFREMSKGHMSERSADMIMDEETSSEPEEPEAKDDVVDKGDFEQRFKAAQTSSKLEHADQWKPCTDFLKISLDTSNKHKVKLPAMKLEPEKKLPLHSQFLASFVALTHNIGENGQYGFAVGDDPGLGKTYVAMGIAVTRMLVWQRWREIREEWAQQPSGRKHCVENADKDAVCPSDKKWWAQCPCQPSSVLHNLRPIDGPTIFLVPKTNVGTWKEEIRGAIDLEELGVQLIVAHKGNEDDLSRFTSRTASAIKTVRDSAFDPPQDKTKWDVMQAGGVAPPDSTKVWILSTWNSIQTMIFDRLTDTHVYHEGKGAKKTEHTQEVVRFHCGLAIVDEAHLVKNPNKGPWRILKTMQTTRPLDRFMVVALSGTLITESPGDLAGFMDVVGSDDWNQPDHKFFKFRSSALLEYKKLIKRHKDEPSKDTHKQAEMIFEVLSEFLHQFQIKRGEGAMWFNELLIDLPKLSFKTVTVPMSETQMKDVNRLIQDWIDQARTDLHQKQQNWDSNPTQQKQGPRPVGIDSTAMFDQSRMQRSCSNLPSLANHFKEAGHRFTTVAMERACRDNQTGRLKEECWLAKAYPSLSENAPKLEAIKRILIKHCDEKVLVFSDFPEFLMVTEKFIRTDVFLNRQTMMFFGDDRNRQEQTFQEVENPDTGERYYKEDVSVMLGKNREMGTGLTLTKATVIILCEPTYMAALLYQMPRRAWRYGQKKEVTFYTLTAGTMIEKLMMDKATKNSKFTNETLKRLADTIQKGDENRPIEVDDD